jgi:hypothetical protein
MAPRRPSWKRRLLAAAVGAIAIAAFMKLSPETWQDQRFYRERVACQRLQGYAAAEESFRAKNGHYGRLGDLITAGLVGKDPEAILSPGYSIGLEVGGPDRFWAGAWPQDPADRTGRCFFVNQAGVVYKGDEIARVDTSCSVPPGFVAR